MMLLPVVGIPRPLIPDQSSSRSGGRVVSTSSTWWTTITTTRDYGKTKKWN